MFQFIPRNPNKQAVRLLKRHVSSKARAELIKDIFTFIIIFACIGLIVMLLAIIQFNPQPSIDPEDNIKNYAFYVLIGLCILFFVFILIAHTIATIKHFKAFRAALSTWTNYQHLITTSTLSQLQGQLHSLETRLNDHNYNISVIRKEQDRLRDQFNKDIKALESQVQTEAKLIAADNLQGEITLLQQLIALRKS